MLSLPDLQPIAAAQSGYLCYAPCHGRDIPRHRGGDALRHARLGPALPSLVGPVIASASIAAGNDSYMYAGVWIACCFFLSGVIVNTPPAWAGWDKR
jgi:hypothetical protein